MRKEGDFSDFGTKRADLQFQKLLKMRTYRDDR